VRKRKDNNSQVEKGGYTGSNLESKADEGHHCNTNASKQALRG
jgi:hypothetical protein